ncbi:MAG: hypothetical protein ABI890_08275, partial [Lapillicoccus sp.]
STLLGTGRGGREVVVGHGAQNMSPASPWARRPVGGGGPGLGGRLNRAELIRAGSAGTGPTAYGTMA